MLRCASTRIWSWPIRRTSSASKRTPVFRKERYPHSADIALFCGLFRIPGFMEVKGEKFSRFAASGGCRNLQAKDGPPPEMAANCVRLNRLCANKYRCKCSLKDCAGRSLRQRRPASEDAVLRRLRPRSLFTFMMQICHFRRLVLFARRPQPPKPPLHLIIKVPEIDGRFRGQFIK